MAVFSFYELIILFCRAIHAGPAGGGKKRNEGLIPLLKALSSASLREHRLLDYFLAAHDAS